MYKKGYAAEAYNGILSIPQTSEVTLKKSYVKLTNAYMSSDAWEKKDVAK